MLDSSAPCIVRSARGVTSMIVLLLADLMIIKSWKTCASVGNFGPSYSEWAETVMKLICGQHSLAPGYSTTVISCSDVPDTASGLAQLTVWPSLKTGWLVVWCSKHCR